MSFDALRALLGKDLDFHTDITFVDGHVLRSLTILNPEGKDEDIVVTEKRLPEGIWEISVKIGEDVTLPWPDYFAIPFDGAMNHYVPVDAFAVTMANHFMGVTSQDPSKGAPFSSGLPHYAFVYKEAFEQRCSDIRLALIQGQVPDWFPTSLFDGPEMVWVRESPQDNPHRRQTRYETFHDVVGAKYREIFPWDNEP